MMGRDERSWRTRPEERLGSHTRRIGSLQHFRWLRGIVISVIILNTLDAILTITWISTGQAVEANPLMADLAHGDPLGFLVVKTVLVALGSWLLWRLRRRRLAVISIFIGFLVYYFVLLYHLSAMDIRLFSRLFA